MASFFKYVSFMLVLLLLCVSLTVGNMKTVNYTQTLDHFHCQKTHLCDTKFNQKLQIDNSHWAGAKVGAPIFVIFGGISDSHATLAQYEFLLQIAVDFKAMLIYIEHRFNGVSIPLGSIDLAMANHQVRACLSIKQVLQDFAEVIQSMKTKLSAHNSPVIVFGVGYGGALASWFRLKYPKLSIGSVASSTPLLYYGSSTPRNGYCEIISNDFKNVDPDCYEMIRQSWRIINDIATLPNGLANLGHYFNTCRPLKSSKEVTNVLAQVYTLMAQYDLPNHELIQSVCEEIKDERIPIKGFATALYSELDGGVCFNSTLTGLASPFDPPSNDTVAWEWLRCSELIYPIGCASSTMLPSQPFNMNNFEKSCQERFGIVPDPHSATSFLGNHENIIDSLQKFGHNMVFSTGLEDPFSSGAILNDLSETVLAITANNGSYFMDLGPISDDDPDWLKEQREKISNILKCWINNYNHTNNRPCTLPKEIKNNGCCRMPSTLFMYFFFLEFLVTWSH